MVSSRQEKCVLSGRVKANLLDHVFANDDLVLTWLIQQIMVVSIKQLQRLILGIDALNKHFRTLVTGNKISGTVNNEQRF